VCVCVCVGRVEYYIGVRARCYDNQNNTEKWMQNKVMVHEITYRFSLSYGALNEQYISKQELVLRVTGCVTLVQAFQVSSRMQFGPTVGAVRTGKVNWQPMFLYRCNRITKNEQNMD
jgi:hypothetical protein